MVYSLFVKLGGGGKASVASMREVRVGAVPATIFPVVGVFSSPAGVLCVYAACCARVEICNVWKNAGENAPGD